MIENNTYMFVHINHFPATQITILMIAKILAFENERMLNTLQ